MRHQVQVLFSGSLTADRMVDEPSLANRVAETAVAAWLTGTVDVYFDTFEDVDRGYFVRSGLVDRRYSPRLAAKVLRHLGSVLAEHDPTSARECSAVEVPRGRLWKGSLGGRFCALLLPRPGCRLEAISAFVDPRWSSLSVVDLSDGRASRVPVGAIYLEDPLIGTSPLWIQADQVGGGRQAARSAPK